MRKTHKVLATVAGALLMLSTTAAANAKETETSTTKTEPQLFTANNVELPELALTIQAEEIEIVEEIIEETVEEVRTEPVSPVPSNYSGSLIDAALAQVGINQDCTDLVQNALAAIGIGERRDMGGLDHGTDIGHYYGYEIHWTEAQPGDIVWHGPTNGGHVYILLDPVNNIGVHGNWMYYTTGVGAYHVPLSQQTVIRLY